MASKELIRAFGSYELYVQKRGASLEVIKAYTDAARVAVIGEKDYTYGLYITNKALGVVEDFVHAFTRGNVGTLKMYSAEHDTTYTVLECYEELQSLNAKATNEVADEARNVVARKKKKESLGEPKGTYEKYADIRSSKGLKDADVAKLTKITKSTFSDWKYGRSKPKLNKMCRIAYALDVPVESLI